MQDLDSQAEQIFTSVLSLDPDRRAQYLEEVCHDAPQLRLKVERLLADDERADSFLNQPLNPALCVQAAAETATGNGTPAGIGALESPQFKVGDLVHGRFAIVRYIARGGMGEVYEAEDLQLKRARIALKTIRSHFAADPLMHERLKREVLVVRGIPHPHVCPIYDLFVWDRPEGRLLFLTMKLLEGETLAARLARQGRLPLDEITAITRQIGSGLVAAHDAGVLHRDIKPANILLNGAGEDVYVYITDFGLARAVAQESTALTVQGVAGTPGYVAPELFHGEAPSRASDVYAFGVVVFQMFTGHLPRAAITDAPTRKELHEAGVPVAWRRMMESCLQPTPAARCSDVGLALQIVPGLAMVSSSRSAPRMHDSRPMFLSRRRVLALAGATAAAAWVGAWVEWDRIRFSFEPIPEKRFVALMAWPNTKVPPILSIVLDLLSQKMSRLEASVKDFFVITPRDLPSEATRADSPEMSEPGLGANLVLAASMEQGPSKVRLDLNLLDAQTKRMLRQGSLSCAPAELGGLGERAFGLAAMLLHLPEHEKQSSDAEELKRVTPQSLQLYSEAEDLVDQPNSTGLKEGIAKYQKALESDPEFALAYAKLAIAYVGQFRLTQETSNLDLALRNVHNSLRFSPESGTGLLGQALVSLYMGKTAEAMTSFAQALKEDPGNPKIMTDQAEALLNTGHLKEAEKVYRDVIALRPNFWPAYNNLGTALARDARYEEAATAFAEAGMAAPSVALPMANLGATYIQLGKKQDARNALRESIGRKPNADAYLALGDLDFEDKMYQSALNSYQQAAEIEPNYHLIHRNIGDCYAMLGDSAKELQSYRRAAEVLRKSLSANPRNGFDWANQAFYDAKIRKDAQAEKDIQNAEANGAADVASRFMLTQALAVMGKKDEALRLLIWCIDNGISSADVDLALDLKGLQRDRRYQEHIRKRSNSPQSGSTV